MDISSEHEADDRLLAAAEAAALPEHEHTVDGTEVDLTEEQKRTLNECEARKQKALEDLEQISTQEAQYGVPADIQRSALCNALANVLVEQGLLTLPELAIRKEIALCDILDEVVNSARGHRTQMEYERTRAEIAQPASAMPPLPPRKLADQRARRRQRRR